jgi:hypothetical protein
MPAVEKIISNADIDEKDEHWCLMSEVSSYVDFSHKKAGRR